MTGVHYDKSVARRQVLQVLYRREITGSPLASLQNDIDSKQLLLIPECPEGVEDFDLVGTTINDYAREIIADIDDKFDDIDELISDAADNWALDRMPIVDRNVIRIAVYEIVYRDKIPTGVAINEAVELAKAFGGDDSSRFVNGVLGRIEKSISQ